MKSKIAKTFICAVFGIFIFINSPICGFAQAEKEKPRIKDFGSSLKRKKQDKAQPRREAGEGAILIETDLVLSDVLILDEKGISVKNLIKDDFVISEDNERQEIEFFVVGDDARVPRSIVLLIDHSISQIPYIVNSVMSAKMLVDNLNQHDRMAIVTDNVELLCDFSRDKNLLKEKLESLKTRMIMKRFGQSRQYSALLAVFNELFSTEDVRRIVIFQTDGDQVNLSRKRIDFGEVITAAEKSRTTVFPVFPGLRYEGLSEAEKYKQAKNEINSYHQRLWNQATFDLNLKPESPERRVVKDFYEKASTQQLFLKQVAEISGGRVEYLETPVQASQIYPKILESIGNRYVIGYYPKNQTKDGKRRMVKIEVKNHPEYQIQGRKTYFADEADN